MFGAILPESPYFVLNVQVADYPESHAGARHFFVGKRMSVRPLRVANCCLTIEVSASGGKQLLALARWLK